MSATNGLFFSLGQFLKLGIRAFLPSPQLSRRSARRMLSLKALSLVREELTFRRNGFLWTGASSSSITEAIYVNDHYQDAGLADILRQISAYTRFDRPVIVNVGANIGDVALPLSRTGKRIVAIEPNPATFRRLKKNVTQNGLEEKITCCAVAISKQAGNAQLVLATDPGNSEIQETAGKLGFEGVDQARGVVDVPTVPLDDLLSSLRIPSSEVALVWSDTQGFESQVIQSGAGLWKEGTPLWVEIWPKGLACHGGVEQFLRLTEQYFTQMLPATALGESPQPIANLHSVVATLQDAQFTDVLLIP